MARVNGTLTGTTLAAGPPVTQWHSDAEDRAGTNQNYIEIPNIATHTALYGPTVAYTGTDQSIISAAGTYSWLCPAGVTQIFVECFGGGGGGYGDSSGNAGYGAGGGGAFASKASVPVTPGTLYTFTVGAGGTSPDGSFGTDGGDTTFTGDSSTQVLAKGGIHSGQTTGGAGGAAASSVGDVGHVFSGGKGGDGRASAPSNGGGGGASGNRVATGAAGLGGGSSNTGGAGANGGGSGGNGASVAPLASQPGSSPGGGGGGGCSASTVKRGAVGSDGEVTISCGVVCPFIGSASVVNALRLDTIPMPFKSSTTVVYALTVQGTFSVPFISSVTAVNTPTILHAEVDVPFISSSTTLYAITLNAQIAVPFISSHTHVWAIMSLFDPNKLYAGQGNGGEGFLVALAPNGVTETATLASSIGTGTGAILSLTGDSAFPTGHPFVVMIDDEQIYVSQITPGHYYVRSRARGNTTAASHNAGADVDWGDSYDQALVATEQINHDFTADIQSSGSYNYPGWLICFDSSQAYLEDGSRYPFHVTELMGVFDAGAGVSGTNRCDGSQPNAICTPAGASDDCPAALSNPARISSDILIGDVAVIRYTNPEAVILDLGPRSASLQSWFGLMRVDSSNSDVTFTDPDGYVVDTHPSGPGPGPFTGSVNDEWDPAPLLTGIAPDASDADPAHAPIYTPNAVPWTTVTLDGDDRYFTHTSAGTGGYNRSGWPICCLAVRQGRKRVPFWQSWDWHDFSYVYSGFATDATYAQILINRNGVIYHSVPAVALPGTQDIDGPDAVWDDADYAFAASWYVVLYNTPYIVAGPTIGGTHIIPIGSGSSNGIPNVSFGGGVPSVGGNPGQPQPPIEGGSGGNIGGSEGLHVWQTS